MIYGTRLKQAREFAKLTQRAVSLEIGVTQAQVSNAERDAYVLPEVPFAAMARLTGFPELFFLRPPMTAFDGEAIHFRSRASIRKAEIHQAERGGQIVAEAALMMLERLDGPSVRIQPLQGCTPMQAAIAVRGILGLNPVEPAAALAVLLEHAGVLIVAIPVDAVRRDAFSSWLGAVPMIALLDTPAGDRQLWSTAHELGHVVLHRNAGASRELEAQADEFARHLLLPMEQLDREIPDRPTLQHFALLKLRWGVSMAALIRTARLLGRLDEHQYASLFRQMSARGERLRERVAVPPIKPRGFRAMAEALYGLSPVQGLAQDARWTLAFTEDVLERHATPAELPSRPVTNVVSLDTKRRRRWPDGS